MVNDNHKESTSKKTMQESVRLEEELRNLQEIELVHLELEFEKYAILYPTINTPSGVH